MLNALRPVTKLLIHWRFRDFAHLAAADGWVFDEQSLKPLRVQPIAVSADSFQYYQRYSRDQLRELRGVFWVCLGFVVASSGALAYAIFGAPGRHRYNPYVALPIAILLFLRGVLSSWAQAKILPSIHRTISWDGERDDLPVGSRVKVTINLDTSTPALTGILARHIGGIIGHRSYTVVESDEIDGTRRIELDAIEGDISSSRDRITLLVPAH